MNIEWFTRIGPRYRGRPWRANFLYKYSRGVGLDLGSGIAATTRELLREGLIERLVLLDLSIKSLESIPPSHRICVVYGDVLDLPFTSECFDTVYMLALLHHIPGGECRRLVIEESYRVLCRDGYLIATVWSPDPGILSRNYELVELSSRDYIVIDRHGRRYYHFFDEDELYNLLVESGFLVVEKGYFVQNPRNPGLTRNFCVVGYKG
jgi:SAM-dependent methyltransferase